MTPLRPTFNFTLRPWALPPFDPDWKSRCLSFRSVLKSTPPRSCEAGFIEVLRCREAGFEPQGHRVHIHCHEARLHDGVCGPEAKLWRKA